MLMLKEFKDFLLKQNVVALAIAVVVATALNTLVKALVDDFIMPIVAAIGPGGEWQKATWSVGSVKFGIGDFIAAAINFLIIGLVAWRISKTFVKPAAEARKKNCAYCRMSIDAAAIRCPHCTSELAPG
jgi:large conductance mechanosensitive channel